MKTLFILLFMLSALNLSAQSNGNGYGHDENDGHPDTHPHHIPTVPMPTGYLFLGIEVDIYLGHQKLKN